MDRHELIHMYLVLYNLNKQEAMKPRLKPSVDEQYLNRCEEIKAEMRKVLEKNEMSLTDDRTAELKRVGTRDKMSRFDMESYNAGYQQALTNVLKYIRSGAQDVTVMDVTNFIRHTLPMCRT